METSLRQKIKDSFNLSFGDFDANPGLLSPITLAFVGDGIYSIIIRTLVLGRGSTRPENLHRKTSAIVKASAQSEALSAIEPLLTDEEADIVRRGRNANPKTMARNASVHDYRRATAFEALLGYLYLKDDIDRLLALVEAGLKNDGED